MRCKGSNIILTSKYFRYFSSKIHKDRVNGKAIFTNIPFSISISKEGYCYQTEC
ncbi:hypothetical protein PRABACTJOHN_03000 [Parabacteroides johnsonii DSM 18315]|uniref:Uncharacterized protein n=1 Tax=Parabacteroides johnsonii DSM 18315 TaxID=537006 RepID=B7BD80_9BACT|nr:hypothetical protein PRABACTJOHN_03000 [Parabacteroides johnsonii DSM 18315]